MTEETSTKGIQNPNKITIQDVKLTIERSDEIPRAHFTIDTDPAEDSAREPGENIEDQTNSPQAQTTEQNEKVYRVEIISKTKSKSQEGVNPFSYTHKSDVIVAMAQGYDAPSNNAPGYNVPGYNAPGYNVPGYNAPGYNAPGPNAPGYGAPGYNAPGYGAPGYGAPVYNAPGYGAPVYNAPGYGAPGYNAPGYDGVPGSAGVGGEGDERSGFVALVLMIVCVCLLVNISSVCASAALEPVQRMLKRRNTRMMMMMTGMIGLLMLSYALMCVPLCSAPPCNYICLTLMVFFYSLILVVLVVIIKPVIIMLSLLILILIVVFGICAAVCCPVDFTRWFIVVLGAMAALCLTSMVLMLARMFGPSSVKTELTGMRLMFSLGFIVVQTVMFIIELQMILGGRAIEMAENEYVTAAIMVYSSIIQMFIQIVQCLQLMDVLGVCCALDDL